MDNAKIFAIVSGETHESHTVRGVFTSLELATRMAENLVARWNGDDSDYRLEDFKTQAIRGCKRWNDGGYFIEVVEWPLDKLLFSCDVEKE